ncbi:MAG: hypothetical protein ACLQVL_23020 [Terriglobia bacterium]
MKKDLLNKSMLAAVAVVIVASMAFAKSPSLDLGRSSKNSAATKTNAINRKHKSSPSQPLDAIKVAGHIPLAGDPITRFVCTQHYSSDYLYAEHGAGKDITLIDITKTDQPSVLANVPDTPDGRAEGLVAVAGTAALVSTEQGDPTAAPTPQTLRIMDFSDPQHPKIAREFTGVTAIGRDEKRGLVFVANAEGIWILQQHFAEDPEVEAEYTRYVLYNP